MRNGIYFTNLNLINCTRFQCLQVLGMLYILFSLVGAVYFYNFLMYGPKAGLAGLLVLPVVYLIEDIVAELYGFKVARSLLWLSIIFIKLFTFFSLVAIKPQVSLDVHYQYAYCFVVDFVFRIIPSALIAISIGRFVNISLLTKGLLWIKGTLFWFRCSMATIAGILFSLLIFFMLAFLGKAPFETIEKLFCYVLSIRLTYTILSSLSINIAVYYIKKGLDIDVYDELICQ